MYFINSLIRNGKCDYHVLVSEPYRTQGWSAEGSEEAGSKAPEDMTPFHDPTQYPFLLTASLDRTFPA